LDGNSSLTDEDAVKCCRAVYYIWWV